MSIRDKIIEKQENWESENNKCFYDLCSKEQDILIELWELEIFENFNRMGKDEEYIINR